MMRVAGIKTAASAPIDVARHRNRLGLVLVSSRVQDLVTQGILTIEYIYIYMYTSPCTGPLLVYVKCRGIHVYICTWLQHCEGVWTHHIYVG